MKNKYPYKEIKSLLSEDKTGEALKQLHVWTISLNDPQNEDSIILLKSNYKNLSRRESLGTMGYNKYLKHKNRIIIAALRINDTLQEIASPYSNSIS